MLTDVCVDVVKDKELFKDELTGDYCFIFIATDRQNCYVRTYKSNTFLSFITSTVKTCSDKEIGFVCDVIMTVQ